jgi:hypothetical protein
LAEYVQKLEPGGFPLVGIQGLIVKPLKKWCDALDALDFDKNLKVSAQQRFYVFGD